MGEPPDHDPPAEPPPPTAAGRYVLAEVLGTGGMGVVYAAYDPELGRRLAIKVLRRFRDGMPGLDEATTDSQQADHRQRFLRESKSLAQIVHPNVVAVYDVGQLGDQLFIAMELIEGGTLRDWMKRGGHPLDEILALFVEIGQGLAAVHAAGFVHRDFKPENVLIGTDGRPRVTDFGLARPFVGERTPSHGTALPSSNRNLVLTEVGAIVGTPGYMAPEQLAGGVADERSDVFAFCVVLWETVFGTRPFAGASLRERYLNIEAQRFLEPRARGPRAALVALLKRGLRFEPAARLPSMNVLLDELRALHRPRAMSTRLVAAASLGVLLAATAGGLLAWRAREQARCRLDPLTQEWSPAKRQQLKQRLTAARSATLATLVERKLEEYAAELRGVYTSACEATFVHRERSAPHFDAQMECLSALGKGLGLVAEELSEQPSYAEIQKVLDRLDRPAICLDRKARSERRSARQQRQFDLLSGELVAAHNALSFGRTDEALAAYERLAKAGLAADEEGVTAQALIGRSQALVVKRAPLEVIASFDVAIATALYARDYAAAVAGYTEQIALDNAAGRPLAETETKAMLAQALIARGQLGPSYRRTVHDGLGTAYAFAGRVLEAERELRSALQLAATDREHANVEISLAQVLTDRDDFPAARALLEDAARRFTLDGPLLDSDPFAAVMLPTSLAYLDYAEGHLEQALQREVEATRIAEALPEGPSRVRVLVQTLADQLFYLRRLADRQRALQIAERAAALTAQLPADDASRVTAELNLASVLNDRGQRDEAHQRLVRLAPHLVAVNPTINAERVRLELELGRSSNGRGQDRDAATHLDKAERMAKTLLGREGRDLEREIAEHRASRGGR